MLIILSKKSSLECIQSNEYKILSSIVLIMMRVIIPFGVTIISNCVLIYNLKKVFLLAFYYFKSRH